MKSGCFVKSIIILTILVAVIMYIIQHKSNWFLKPGKRIFAGAFMNDWDKQYNYVKETPEKNELKNALRAYIDSLELKHIPDDDEINVVAGMVRSAAADSIITKTELKEISQKLELLKNEGSE